MRNAIRYAHGINVNATEYSEYIEPDEIDDANEEAENFTAESSDQAYKTARAETAKAKIMIPAHMTTHAYHWTRDARRNS